MLETAMSGPHRLTFDDINASIKRRSAGAFALGYVSPGGDFYIRYVGRSDDDIRVHLCNLIGSDQYFKFSYYGSAASAFYKECELFHDFKPHGNHMHPERPKGSSLECPRCHLRAGRRP